MPPKPPGRPSGNLASGLGNSAQAEAEVERARGRFRRDVADQLRIAAENAGLAATVTVDSERAVLEFEETLVVGVPRVIVAFDGKEDHEPSGSDRLTLYAEAGDGRVGLDLSDIGQNAAERFDRGVNGNRASRRWLGLRGPGAGPG